MSTVTLLEPTKWVDANLEYLSPSSKVNRRYVASGAELNTGVYEKKSVKIYDGRDHQAEYSLDKTGFQLVKHESKLNDLRNQDELNKDYIPEIEEFLKELTGADKVIAFGPLLRQTKPVPGSRFQPPGSDVHVDYTESRSQKLANKMLASRGLAGSEYSRVVCINVWRAISPGPQDWPLAMCEAQSVARSEGQPNVMIYVDKLPDVEQLPELPPDPAGEAVCYQHSPMHKWTYFSNMQKDEVLVFKLYDSKDGVEAWRTPHAAFDNSSVPGAVPRESVEIRSVAYFK